MRWIRDGVAWAGLATGPTAWALSTQINYALAPWPAAQGTPLVPLIALALIIFAIAGAAVSWRAWRVDRSAALVSASNGEPHQFVAGLGTLSGLLFALVIAMQGAAGLMVEG